MLKDDREIPSFGDPKEFFFHHVSEVGERMVQLQKQGDLFNQAQKLKGFEEAKQSVKSGWINTVCKIGKLDQTKLEPEHPEYNQELFFLFLSQSSPEHSLRQFHQVIEKAARDGNLEFFKRLSVTLRRSKNQKGRFEYHLLRYWVHGFLWLMSDPWGSRYLEWRLQLEFPSEDQKVDEAKYKTARQNLGLVSWNSFLEHPLIEGFNIRNGKFTLREGGGLDSDPESAP